MLQAAAPPPVVETGESEDVGTRFRLHCNGTGLLRAQIWRSGTHARKQCEIWAQFRPNPLVALVRGGRAQPWGACSVYIILSKLELKTARLQGEPRVVDAGRGVLV